MIIKPKLNQHKVNVKKLLSIGASNKITITFKIQNTEYQHHNQQIIILTLT